MEAGVGGVTTGEEEQVDQVNRGEGQGPSWATRWAQGVSITVNNCKKWSIFFFGMKTKNNAY